jgi:glycosyltransferase involved in cell wall biosynthesis
MRIHLIRTHHPHWGQYTGAHQFIHHLETDRFQVDERVVAMGDDDFPIRTRAVRLPVKFLTRLQGMRVYGLNDLLAELAAGRQWWRQEVDLLHYLEGEHTLQFLPHIMSKLGSLRSHPPIVATFHQPPELLESLINFSIVQRIDHVIVLSPEQVSYFTQHLPTDRVSMILHGVDTDFFRPTDRKRAGSFRCLSVGSWMRDYNAILEVAQRLQSVPQFEFQIVSRAVANRHVPANVSVQSGIDDDALRTLYQEADVLFLPVTSATANNAVLEGIACGLPVVSTDLASLRTYLPGQEAILVGDNEPGQLAETLLMLYHNPQLRGQMGLAARQRALQLSWPTIAKQHEALYEKLVAPPSYRDTAGEQAG